MLHLLGKQFMSLPVNPKTKRGAKALEEWLRKGAQTAATSKGGQHTTAFPSTRALADRFGVSNVTAFRILQKLHSDGQLWKKPNGRYFAASLRRTMEEPQPVYCLLRNLESWTASYREIMAGFSTEMGEAGRAFLMNHNETLVTHPSIDAPPSFAAPDEQKNLLARALRIDSPIHGWLLDHLWHDSALVKYRSHLKNAVLLWRETPLPWVTSVLPDFMLAATQVLAHLISRGYHRILVAHPFQNDPAIEQMIAALSAAGKSLGIPVTGKQIRPAARASDRKSLVKELHQADGTGVFCPEDNIASLLLSAFRENGLLPPKTGLISGMGTYVARNAGLTCLEIPFREMGQIAARILEGVGGPPRPIQTRIIQGSST
jgi:DNA-binding LacI/PurR family transcriptional regulator